MLLLFTFKIGISKGFSDEMIKVSVGKTKRTGLLARIIALILQILVPRRVYLATIKGVFY